MITSAILAAWLATNLDHQFCGRIETVLDSIITYGIPLGVVADSPNHFVLGWPVDDNYNRYLRVAAIEHDGFTVCQSDFRFYNSSNQRVDSSGKILD